MARATGVQITGSVVRVVDIDGSAKKFKIRGFGEASFLGAGGGGDDADLAKAVKEAFKAAKASREHVILGIPIRDCIVREITIPFTNLDQIRKVIKFESESHLHSCSIDDVVICFHKVAESGNRSTLVVVAARKDNIQRYLAALERAGVDPLSVDLDAAALFSVVQCLDEPTDKKTFAVCDIGYTSTMINLVHEGDLRLVRSVRMGTDSITSRVSKDLDIGRDEARDRTQAILAQDKEITEDLFVRAGDVMDVGPETGKSANELERDIVRQRQHDLIKRLEQEIYRTVNPAKLEEPLECIYLIGPGSNLPRLQSELAERMKIPVRGLHVLEEMDHKFDAEAAGVVDAVVPIGSGLALKHVGNDPLKFDFRQEEFVFAKKFDRLKVPLFCLIVLLSALNLFWWYFEKKKGEQQDIILQRAAERAATEFRNVVDPEKIRPDRKDVITSAVDEPELRDTFLGAGSKGKTALSRIVYMGKSIKKIRKELRSAYGLASTDQSAKSPRRGSRTGRGGGEVANDLSDFVSALERLEVVFKAVHDTGVQGFAFNRIHAKTYEVTFGLTIPKTAEVPGKGTLTTQQILALIQENLEKTAEGTKFLKLEDTSPPKPRDDDRGVDYPRLVATFEREGR